MRFFLLFLTSSLSLAQQIKYVDFKTMNASLEINPLKRNVVGDVSSTFYLKSTIDTIRIDAQMMVFSNLKINGKSVNFKENKKQLLLFEGYSVGKNNLTFTYEAFPTQTMYFVNWDFTKEIDTPEEVSGQIWTQGQGKYTSHWLPSFDDVNEKVIFGLEIKFHKSFEVVSNGKLIDKKTAGDDLIWKYQMKMPMSSYLVMLAIGHFEKQTNQSKSNIPLINYYEKDDLKSVEPTYRYSTEIFDFLEQEIGYSYPWEIYRQIPVHDFLYAGMENTTSTLFSREFVVDSIGYNDRNYLNINAHELAHQWFGNLVTARSGKDHWLQEGFATYYALLAEQEVFGEDYFYYKLYNMSRQLSEAAKADTIPLWNEKASALSFYQKGAWALHFIRETVGRKKFNKAVKNYLKKYAFQTVTTDNFLKEVQKVSKFDIVAFSKQWLESSIFPLETADKLLLKSPFLKQYFELRNHPLDLINNREEIMALMKSRSYHPIKELLVFQSISEPFDKKEFLLKAAMMTNDISVRQAVASALKEIPSEFREFYETLLFDSSYDTQETALFYLWKQFPERRPYYIEVSKNWIGHENRSLRTMHLYLAYLTETEALKKESIYLQLLRYTGTNFDSNVQQEAMEKLLNLEIHTEDVFRSLAYGLANHRWQFVKFCRDQVRLLLKDKMNRDLFEDIAAKLPVRERIHLQKLLNEKK